MLERVGLHVWLVPGCFLDCFKSMALCCPLINKVFSAGWCREGGLWGQAPHVIDVEFGWGLLKCVEALHLVVLGGNGAPWTQLTLQSSFCSVSFPETALYLVLNFLFRFWSFSPKFKQIYDFHLF